MDTRQLEKVEQFVKETCNGRDPSHGFEHMYEVAQLSTEIFCKHWNVIDPSYLCGQEPWNLEMIMLVAYLHDVADHKYDHDGTLNKKVYDFLLDYFKDIPDPKNNANWIMKIIDKISYSKENKYIKEHGHPPTDLWLEELGSDGLEIRNIVSDADKLEALGQIGFLRCKQYTEESYFEKYGKKIPFKILVESIVEHYNEKLKRLPTEFIRTDAAKKMAEPRLEELACWIRSMQSLLYAL